MADVKDPVDELAYYLEAQENCTGVDCNLSCGRALRAIAELRRRARVERRLEKWLDEDDFRGVVYRRDVITEARFRVRVQLHESLDKRVAHADGPDYWTACDGALDDAGAPKESE